MANTKVPDLTGLSSPATGDELYIVDKSDTTDSVDGTSKKITRSNLLDGISGSVVGTTDIQTLTNKTLTSPTITTGVIATSLDMNGTKLILDADANTSITADTDDQIDIEIAGADDFRITANTFTALSGSSIAVDTIVETTSSNGVSIDGVKLLDNFVELSEISAPSNPSADKIRLYTKTEATSKLYFKDSAGTETEVGAGVMTDSGAYVKPSTDGDEIRAFHTTGGSDYIELQHDGSNAIITAGADHIVLTPASNKLVKIAIEERSITTNTQPANTVVLGGWNYDTGDGTVNLEQSQAFGVTFDSAPNICLASVLGVKQSAGAPTVITDIDLKMANDSSLWGVGTAPINTTTCTINQRKETGTTFTSGDFYAYSFIVLGQIS